MEQQTKTYIQCGMGAESGNGTIRIENPKSDVTAESFQTTMEQILSYGVLSNGKGDAYDSLRSAKKVTVQEELWFDL